MISENQTSLFSLDEAVDIARAGVNCKKNKQYGLARIYLTQAAERMIGLRMDLNIVVQS
jgi:hypothetical protein